MKVTIEVDCTPEEARRAVGLPDLSPLHEAYLGKLRDGLERGSVAPEMLGQLVKTWAPLGDAGIDFWRSLLTSKATSKDQ